MRPARRQTPRRSTTSDILQPDLTIISSASAPARFGYASDWLIAAEDAGDMKPFLTRIPLETGSTVAFAAIHLVSAGEKSILVVGARKLNAAFLASLGVAPGVRAMLWLPSEEVIDAAGPIADARKLSGLLDTVRRTNHEASATVEWTGDPASAESVVALPLAHRGTLLGALLVGTSLREQ